jgi:hypothetical protein
MKTIALALALFAIAPRAHAQDLNHRADWRGTVAVTGRAVKAVTTGPALLHGHSEFSGGALFVAPVATGTDADCATALASGGGDVQPLVADRVAYVSVGAGQVACLMTDARRPFELLWHAFRLDGSYLAAAKSHARSASRAATHAERPES